MDVPKYAELPPAFQDAVNTIIRLYNWQKPKAESEAHQFVSWIGEKAISAKFDPSVVDDGVQLFIADLENIPVSATVKVFLLGVIPRRPSISMGDKLTIRKVCEGDLSLEYDVTFPPPKQRVPHSIAEIHMDVARALNE
ncbi:MAG: hypothetical protein NWF13_07345 [Candidatus Bathyarchaeota archaeon]|nr:hypothetical protein [Candidatus Bathyarchaeota archaeon]